MFKALIATAILTTTITPATAQVMDWNDDPRFQQMIAPFDCHQLHAIAQVGVYTISAPALAEAILNQSAPAHTQEGQTVRLVAAIYAQQFEWSVIEGGAQYATEFAATITEPVLEKCYTK